MNKSANERIVVNGGSSTQEYHLALKDRWSTLIGATHNLALGGGSNDRCFRTTIQFLNETDVDVLIIGWTVWTRTSFTKANGSYYVVSAAPAHDENNNQERDQEITKMYLTKMFNEYLQLENTLNYMLHIQNFCMLKKIRLLNFSSGFGQSDLNDEELEKISEKSFVYNSSNKKVIQQVRKEKLSKLKFLIGKLDPTVWLNRRVFFSMEDGLKDFPTIDSAGHFGKDGARHWANIIKKHL